MIPYWYKLLECKSKGGATGLTVPFLIGASKLLPETKDLTISDFITDVSNNQHGEVMLKYCNQTRHFIMTVNSNFILHKSYIKHIKFGNLLVVPERNLKGLDDLNHIITSFEIDYDSLIQKGKHSIVNAEPHDFSKEDISFIRRCLKV